MATPYTEYDAKISNCINLYLDNTRFIPLRAIVDWLWTKQAYEHISPDIELVNANQYAECFMNHFYSFDDCCKYTARINVSESYSVYCAPKLFGKNIPAAKLMRIDTHDTKNPCDIIEEVFLKYHGFLGIPLSLNPTNLNRVALSWFAAEGYKNFFIYNKKYL